MLPQQAANQCNMTDQDALFGFFFHFLEMIDYVTRGIVLWRNLPVHSWPIFTKVSLFIQRVGRNPDLHRPKAIKLYVNNL